MTVMLPKLTYTTEKQRVELVEGVDDHRGRLRHAGGLVGEEVGRGADEARQVAEAQVDRRAGDPVDDGVEVSVGGLGLVDLHAGVST
jgi:hypothetical protein